MNVFQNQLKSHNSSFKATQAPSSTRLTYTISADDKATGNTSLGPVSEEIFPVRTTMKTTVPALTITEAEYVTEIMEGPHFEQNVTVTTEKPEYELLTTLNSEFTSGESASSGFEEPYFESGTGDYEIVHITDTSEGPKYGFSTTTNNPDFTTTQSVLGADEYEYGNGSGDGETEFDDISTSTEESEYGSGDHLTESEESRTSLVHVSGSMPTQYNFIEDFAIKEIEKYENFENEIKRILESNSLIENAEVTLTGIKTNSSNRRRRSNGKVIVEFASLLSILVPKIDDMGEIASRVCSSIQAIDSTLFESFDEDSFSSCDLSFSKPRILPFKAPSKAVIDAKIG